MCWLSGARGRGGAEAVLFIMPEVQSCYCKRRPSSQSPIPMKEAEAASRSSKHARFAAGRAMESATRYVHNAYMALFGLPHIRFVGLVFSAGTVFFSHNNSVRTIFFSEFQPSFRSVNGATKFWFGLLSIYRVKYIH